MFDAFQFCSKRAGLVEFNKMKKILIVSGTEKNSRLFSWSNKNRDFDFTLAVSDEIAIEMAHIGSFDIIVADSTDVQIDIKKLQAVLPILQDNSELVIYAGETMEKLEEEISMVFKRKKEESKQKILVLDSVPEMWAGLPGFSAN